MGTLIEGQSDKIFEVIRKCHKNMMLQSDRVVTYVNIDDKKGISGNITSKVKSVEKVVGKYLPKGQATLDTFLESGSDLKVHNIQASEILDVVDMSDRVIGQATRDEIHDKGWLHRAVHIFLFNSLGAIYVQRRARWKAQHPLKLDSSAAGHVDSGETYLEAAKRELYEELGVTAALIKLMNITACPATDNEHVVLYETYSDFAPVPNPEEICDGAFVDPMELSDLMSKGPNDFVPAFILMWELRMRVPSKVQTT